MFCILFLSNCSLLRLLSNGRRRGEYAGDGGEKLGDGDENVDKKLDSSRKPGCHASGMREKREALLEQNGSLVKDAVHDHEGVDWIRKLELEKVRYAPLDEVAVHRSVEDSFILFDVAEVDADFHLATDVVNARGGELPRILHVVDVHEWGDMKAFGDFFILYQTCRCRCCSPYIFSRVTVIGKKRGCIVAILLKPWEVGDLSDNSLNFSRAFGTEDVIERYRVELHT